MLTLVNPEQRVPANHPIRLIKELAEVALKELSPLFEQMYSEVGRPSIPPERLLKASLLMALYSVRSERMFCEQLDYNLLFRWFLDLSWDETGFDHSSFSRNRARLLEHDVAGEFFRTVVAEARELKLTSDEHFTVDGTLIEAWASLKSFRPKGEKPSDRTPPDDPGNPSVNFHGERRQNATHQSTTDPEARLAKKGAGKEARLCYTESVLMENRNGLMIDLRVGQASGRKPATQRLLDRIVEGRSELALERIPTRRPSAGTVLIRDWRGVSHRVTVLDNDVVYRKRRYKSLSEVARAITGTRWSGLAAASFPPSCTLSCSPTIGSPVT
jgi:transposase